MRCKNCGTDNDDNRYICETCGSPLYDEEDFDNTPDERTSSVSYNRIEEEPVMPSGSSDDNDDKEKMKKSVITIAVLVVILIAIIASVAVVASTKSRNRELQTTDPQTTVSEAPTEEYNTTERTTVRTTAEKTSTTKPSTTKETTAAKWIINVSSSGGGQVSGAGEYENGKKVTITATADEGYRFDGWYSNGVKVSSSAKYTFKANENTSFSAVFYPVEEPGDTDETPSENTEIMFGDND